jgi:hypothetical protein
MKHGSVETERSIPLLTLRKMEVLEVGTSHRPKRRRRDAAEDYLESGAQA